jgi:N-acetylated-alpha-linked acidic dipeptidase
VASLNRLIVETVRDVRDPATGGSVLEAWGTALRAERERVIGGAAANTSTVDRPIDYPGNALGSGSDYTVFLNFLGVPIVEMSFDGPYGVYHSIYDDYYWMTRFGDPGFRYMTAMADVWGRMALRLANAEAYPFDFGLYADRVSGFIDDLAKVPGADRLRLQPVRAAVRRWRSAGTALDSARRALLARPSGAGRTGALQAMNGAMRLVEQQLLLSEGIPDRPWFRHALYAPRPTYAAMTLPGIREAVEAKDLARAAAQVTALAARLNAAAAMVERAARSTGR